MMACLGQPRSPVRCTILIGAIFIDTILDGLRPGKAD